MPINPQGWMADSDIFANICNHFDVAHAYGCMCPIQTPVP